MNDYKFITEKEEWDNALSQIKKKDVYFKYEYSHLYSNESDTPMLFFMDSSLGKAIYPFMLRDISYEEALSEKIEKGKFFDIITAYGYGGPIVEPFKEEDRVEFLKEIYSVLEEFFREKNIITEFIRFSPLLENHKEMENVVETQFLRKTVATDLQNYGDPVYGEVKRRKRYDANKSRRLGMSVEFVLGPKNLDAQRELYYDTMERNKAYDFYYFSKEYFDNMCENLSDNLLLANNMLNGELINFDLCFIYDGFIHGHLTGTVREYLKYSPGDLSMLEVISWGHKNNCKYLFTGGGLTNSEDDSLYHYKKAFARNTDFDFYIGKKIWNKEVYDYLCTLASDKKRDNDFFPNYRVLK